MHCRIRIASVSDASAVNEVYGYYIAHSLANFGEQNISDDERAIEIASQLGMYPFFIAEDESGRFLGFACAEPFRAKSGYRYTAELTIYLHPEAPKQAGIGSALYEKLLSCLAAQGFRIALGVLYAENQASLKLHHRFGFKEKAFLHHYCYKHGQWVDARMMEKTLNSFDDIPAPLIPFSEYRKQLEDS